MKASQYEYESVSKKKVYADGIHKKEEENNNFSIIFKEMCVYECFIELLIMHVQTSSMCVYRVHYFFYRHTLRIKMYVSRSVLKKEAAFNNSITIKFLDTAQHTKK